MDARKEPQTLSDIACGFLERHGYAYEEAAQHWPFFNRGMLCMLSPPNFPSFQQVRASTASTAASLIDFERDGLKWRSDYRICQLTDSQGVWNNLVIRLRNDVFFYVAENLLPVLASNRRNSRHLQTCSEGWAYIPGAHYLAEVELFEDFASAWYGYDAEKKVSITSL